MTLHSYQFLVRPLAAALASATLALSFGGCAPLVVGGAMVGGAMVATDRRSSGAQLEDQSIELKAASRIKDVVGERGHINVTSYNRMVLLTGEAANEQVRQAAEQAVAQLENVRSLVNEIAIMGNSSMSTRSNDVFLQSKVKATFIDARDLQSQAFKVVTERGIVYLMGMVTEREATRAAELTRTISGVQKVVRVFEVVSEDELARTQPKSASSAPSAPARQQPAQ